MTRGPVLFVWQTLRTATVALAAQVAVLFVWAPSTCWPQEANAVLHTGRQTPGRLRGDDWQTLRFRIAGRQPVPLDRIRQIRFPHNPVASQAARPLRRMELGGRERLTMQLSAWDDEVSTVVIRGTRKSREIPAWAVRKVTAPAGERDVVYEDFEKLPTIWQPVAGQPSLDNHRRRSGRSALRLDRCPLEFVYRPRPPVPKGRLSLAFFDVADRADTQWGLKLTFSTGTLTLLLGNQADMVQAVVTGLRASSSQPLRRSAGWRSLSLLFDEKRLLALVDDHVLVAGSQPPGPLNAVRVFCRPTGTAPEKDTRAPAVWLDDFQIQRFVRAQPIGPAVTRQDALLMSTADEIYGRVTNIDAHTVRISGAFGSRQIPWTEVSGAQIERPARPLPGVVGWSAEIEFQPFVDHRSGSPDRLIAAIRSASGERLAVDHLVLGRVRIPWRHVRTITPRSAGRRRVLFPFAEHLGDEVRQSFRRPLPAGHKLAGEFSLDRKPDGRAVLTVDVSEMEPSGPETPPGSPFLQELKAGYLRTACYVNDRHVADLNDHLKYRRSLEPVQEIRIPLPAGLLKTGINTWRLNQRPSRHSSTDFDDCEVGPLALEWEEKSF